MDVDWIGLLIYCCLRQWNGKCMERAPRPRERCIIMGLTLSSRAIYEKRRRYFFRATERGIR